MCSISYKSIQPFDFIKSNLIRKLAYKVKYISQINGGFVGYLCFPAPGSGPGSRRQPWPLALNLYWPPQPSICIFRPESPICIYRLRPSNCFYQPRHSICVCLFFDLQLKVVSAIFLLVCFVSLKERTCETRKNAFYFTSKALFVLEILAFQIFKCHDVIKCPNMNHETHSIE